MTGPGNRAQIAGNRAQIAGNRAQIAGNRAQIAVFTSGASSNLAGGFRVRCGLCTSWEKHCQV